MELHPRIDLFNTHVSTNKIILGSFPTWTLTAPDPEKNESLEEKEFYRNKNSDLPFFYGSSTNNFWNWYKEYIDPTISREDLESIKFSLHENSIGLSDMILRCTRKGKSSLDKDLTMRTYNHAFFNYPSSKQSVKILCTSKGVMNEMLLNKYFFKKHPNLSINETESDKFQNNFLSKINGDKSLVKKPFYRVLEYLNGGSIECFSIPSPGSPYRKLSAFGLSSFDLDNYLNTYLTNVFEWFLEN